MEVLAETSLGKYNANPKLELQKLENLNRALVRFRYSANKLKLKYSDMRGKYAIRPLLASMSRLSTLAVKTF